MARATFLGRLAGVTQIIFGVLLGVVASFGFEPGFVPRGVVLLVMFALPGIVGLVGVASHRPALLVAAGLTSFVGAFIAFSGVSLIFLVPAFMFLVAAALLAVTARPAGLTGWLVGLGRLTLSAVIVVLLIGTGASALLVTDSGCWSEYRTADGVRIELGPYIADGREMGGDAMSMGCSTGFMSARGVGLAGLLGTGALALALVVARRRPSDPTDEPQVSGSGIHSPSAMPTATNSG